MRELRSRKEVDEYFAGDKIECLECGKLFKSLVTHIGKIHGMSVDEYKEKYNLPWGRGLVSNATSIKQAAALKKRMDSGEKSLLNGAIHITSGHQAPKRKFRDYDMNRLQKDAKKLIKKQKENTYQNAVKILEGAEALKCPACCVCTLPGYPGLHNLTTAAKEHREIKTRYEKLKRDIPRGVELKTDSSYAEIKKQIISLREQGLTTREIAKELFIGRTTVKRALRNDGAFKNC